MTTLNNNENVNESRTVRDFFITDLRFDENHLYVTLKSGAEIVVPLWWYPRLQHALPSQREHWELCAGGRGIHWPDIDEDLDAYGFIHGLKSPDAVAPMEH